MDLSGLNKEQIRAVKHIDGPMLVLAGAGSGKTKVLTSRIAYLIEQGVSIDNILAITFTNKAAKEMKEREIKLIGYDAKSIQISTFHSLGLKIIKENYSRLGYKSNFVILDSDDSIPEKSLELIAKFYSQIKDDDSFGGVCGYMAHHDGTIIGKGSEEDILDTNSIDLRYRYNVKGDMCEVFKTSVLREIPFPEIDGERFCPESLVWNRIAKKYRLRVFHNVVYYRDYLDGGLTDKIVKIRMQSPIASMMCYQEMNELDIPFIQKIKAAINYWRFRFCSDSASKPVLKWYWNWVMPVGYLLHLKDLHECKS